MCSILTRSCRLIWIAALLAVTPSLTLAAGSADDSNTKPSPPTAAQLAPIHIDITTHLGDRQTFLEGDVVSFFLNLDREAYILVVYEDAAGHRYQVVPNKYQPDNHYRSGLFIPIPPAGARYRFRIAAPYGEESLWVFASDRPLGDFAGHDLANGLRQLSASLARLRQSVTGQSRQYYGEARLVINTRASR